MSPGSIVIQAPVSPADAAMCAQVAKARGTSIAQLVRDLVLTSVREEHLALCAKDGSGSQ